MNDSDIISHTIAFAETQLTDVDSGHDINHALRVLSNARLISRKEPCNLLVVELASILHDIADSKFNKGDEEKGLSVINRYLLGISVKNEIIEQVIYVIRNLSYSKGDIENKSKELEIVQDADRLDAIGAIGIARAFSYGGYMSRPFFVPSIKPNTDESKKNPTTINHFFEKLLLIKDKMNTKMGKKLAKQRHDIMEQYIQFFFEEWFVD